jgi:two-component system response regulator AtoC
MKPELEKILIIDDEASLRHMLRLVLEREGYQVSDAANGLEALALMDQESFDLLLCDVRMPEMDGLGFLRAAIKRVPAPTVIMMSAYGTIDSAIECMKEGAYDYIAKPFKPDEIILTLRKAEERFRLLRENAALKEKLSRSGTPPTLVFRSAAMREISSLVQKVASSSSPVLITGETGTGKELVARALHAEGERKNGPFVAVNCSAISPTLIESELFGHAKGAFTGADRERSGLFAAAHRGTLFLDEIGELPLELQPKLLRVLQEGEILRVGETQPRRIDVRVVAATARNVREEVAKGRFREDLFYRLAVVEIQIPPLRERREDIPELTRYFLTRIAGREGRKPPVLSAECQETLAGYLWPGNVRELENFMEKTMIFNRGEVIERTDLPGEVRRRERGGGDYLSLKNAVTRLEREFISKALAVTGGNQTQAAKLLEISLRGMLYKMKEYGLE